METYTPITISNVIKANLELVWTVLNEPQHIMQWLHASDDWHCPAASNDLRVGGELRCRMAARDASFEFDLTGIYLLVEPLHQLTYVMENQRHVHTELKVTDEGIVVTQTFDAENETPLELQRQGWQAILDNFKAHTERIANLR